MPRLHLLLPPYALAVAVSALALVLAACSGSAPAAPAAAPTSNAGSTGAQPAANASVVEISLHYPVGVSGTLAKIIDTYVGQFNQEHPTIKVTPVYDGDYPSTAAKVLQLSQAGTPADVAIVNAAAIYQMTDANAVMPT